MTERPASSSSDSDPGLRWSAAIVNHGSFAELATCLESLAKQTCPPRVVVVWDTGLDPAALERCRTRHPDVRFVGGENRGYAGGANSAIDAVRADPQGGDSAHVLVLNPDVVLDPDFAERLGRAVEADPEVALATGKLLRPGRERIDSAGIVFPRHRRPRDRGSEERDLGQFDRPEFVDAASGAALWLRVAACEALRVEGELFDEAFFAYHEDTDLGWRARRLGWRVLYLPEAVAVHARGWQKAGRAAVPVAVRRHSFKNHYLQLAKNETLGGGLVNAPWLIGWEVLRLGFVLLRDRAMLPAYGEAWRALPRALRWRRAMAPGVRAAARRPS